MAGPDPSAGLRRGPEEGRGAAGGAHDTERLILRPPARARRRDRQPADAFRPCHVMPVATIGATRVAFGAHDGRSARDRAGAREGVHPADGQPPADAPGCGRPRGHDRRGEGDARGGPPHAGPGPAASKVGTTKRSDVATEVTYNGHPLYTCAGDSAPGQTSGQGLDDFGAEWYALSARGDKVDRG